jgi:hypothetical protein
MFANMLGGVYFGLASITQTPEWLLTQPEALDYADKICTALEYFDVDIDPKTMAVSQAVLKSFEINLPRMQATAVRAAARRRQAAGGMPPGQQGQAQRRPPGGAQEGQEGQGGQAGGSGHGTPNAQPSPADMAMAAATTPPPPPAQPELYGAANPQDHGGAVPE